MPATPGITIQRITGQFHLSNGQTVDFQITAGVGWSQWGNTDDNMFVTNGLADELAQASIGYLDGDEGD